MHYFNLLFISIHFSFAILFILIWLNELLDLPFLLGIGPKTPINISESIIESILVVIVWVICIISVSKICKRIKILEGILPICSSCKKIRNKEENWQNLENFITEKSEAKFSHSICPECFKKLYPDIVDKLKLRTKM